MCFDWGKLYKFVNAWSSLLMTQPKTAAKTESLYLPHSSRRNANLTEMFKNTEASRRLCETVWSSAFSAFTSPWVWRMKQERNTVYSSSEQKKQAMMEELCIYISPCPCSCLPRRERNPVRKMNRKPVRAFPLFHLSFCLSFTPFVPFLLINHIHTHSLTHGSQSNFSTYTVKIYSG